MHNYAEVADYGGRRVLSAQQGPFALALAAVTGAQREAFGRASAGYVGASDGWQDFARNGAMTWEYSSAGPGNVALLAELPRCSRAGARFRQQRRICRDAGADRRYSSPSSTRATGTSPAGPNGTRDCTRNCECPWNI